MNVQEIAKNGCEKRHKVSKHIFSCPDSKICPCAEQCLNRANEFTPKEAAAVWMAIHRVNHNHDYRSKK